MQATADNFDTTEQLQVDLLGQACIEYMLGKYYTWYSLGG